MIRAILFDLDGVLIETERETFEFYRTRLAEYGIHLEDSDFKYKAGRKSVDFWNDVLTSEERARIDTKALTGEKRRAFNATPERYVKKVEGGKEVLENLRQAGYLLALTTQNEAEMARTAMQWLGITEHFHTILTLSDISRKKPDPEIYLLAAQKLGVDPAECVVIEDSKNGVAAAKNADMYCVALQHDYMPPEHTNEADLAIDDIRTLTPEFIETMVKK